MKTDGLLPSFAIKTTPGNPHQNLAQWREATNALFDVEPSSEPFDAEIYEYSHGPLLFWSSAATAQRFLRDQQVIQRSPINHLLIQAYIRGGFSGTANGQPITVEEGDVVVFDLARTFEANATPSENISLIVPRDILAIEPLDFSLHGIVVTAGMPLATLLRTNLIELVRVCATATPAQRSQIVDLTLSLVSILVRDAHRDATEFGFRPSEGSPLGRTCAYIDENLAEHDLTIPRLCDHFGMSRASLYRLFDPIGGVITYIRNRRLDRAYWFLSQRGNSSERIGVLSERLGFESEDTFARAFKARFGLSPRQLRRTHRTPLISNAHVSPIEARVGDSPSAVSCQMFAEGNLSLGE